MEISLIQIVDVTAAKIATAAFMLVIAKFASKRLGKNGSVLFKKADTWFMKIHKPASIILIISGVIHGVLSAWSISRVGISPFVAGIICILSCMASAIFFFLKKNIAKSWLYYHRMFTVIALITFLGHIMLAKG